MKQRFKKIVSGLLCFMLVMSIAPSGVVFAADMELSFPAEIVHVGDTAAIAGFSNGATFVSSDNNVATVDSNGVVTGVSVGKATITATVEGSSASIEIPVVGKNLINRAGNDHAHFAAGSLGIFFNNEKDKTLENGTIWYALKSSSGYVYDYERAEGNFLPGRTDGVKAAKFTFDGNGPANSGKVTLKLQVRQKVMSGSTDPETQNPGLIMLDKNKIYELSGWVSAENTEKLATDLSCGLEYYNCDSGTVRLAGFESTPWAGKSGNQAWESFSTPALMLGDLSASTVAAMPVIQTTDATKKGDILITEVSLHEVEYGELKIISPKEKIQVGEAITFSAEHYTNTGNQIKEVVGGEPVDVKGGVVYRSLNPEIIEPMKEGSDEFLAVSEGTATIEATATIGGVTQTGTFEIKVEEPKDGAESVRKISSTYYTPEMIAAARENAENYTWASKTVTAAVQKADKWLPHVDTIYNMVTNHTIPRSKHLGENGDPLNGYCLYCGANLKSSYGNEGYNIDMINRPWEIQCRKCTNYFPSNDFNAFYKNGLDEHGEFDRTLALENNGILCGRGTRDESGNYVVYDEYKDNPYGYGDPRGNLYNKKFTDLYEEDAVDPYHKDEITQGWGSFNVGEEYGVPSAGYFWGVDDGLGYNTGRKSGSVNEIHRYVAIANYNGIWYWHDKKEVPIVYASLAAFRDAYVYTGDKKYAIAGAKILDRVADLYPDFDFGVDCANLVTSGLGAGKISGSIHENFVNRVLTTAYDAFFDCYDEPELIEYLSEKAEVWKLETKKTSGARLRKHVEDNILLETYNAVKSADIKGNFGMAQQTLITAAVILDNEDTAEIIDYVMRSTPDGGGLYEGILTTLSRDGYGSESSLSYNNIFASTYYNIVEILARYPKIEPRYDIANNPRAINGLIQGPDTILAGVRHANIGDNSVSFQGTGITDRSSTWLYGLKNTDNPVFAQMLYLTNGKSTEGLRYDIFTKDPESAEEDVAKVIKEHGEFDLTKSNILTGYGFAALRDGTLSTQINTMQDWWMYWGPYNTTHGHADALNLGLDAFGLNMAPDLGYGSSGSTNSKWISQWVEGTPAHNTVVVNNQKQTTLRQSHFPLHFDDSGDVKVMDIDVPDAYRNVVDAYRRTIVSVAIDETVSYALDFFRIVGGNEHVYAFHSASEESTFDFNEGVELVAQTGGTYAGKDIAYGAQYAEASSGFSWLVNVERATNPGKNFSVDFKVTDYRNYLKSNRNLHLKLTQLNGFELNEVARADGEPIPRSNNPKYIDHILVRRSGTDLDTLFTTVLEPYEDNSKINALTRVDVVRKDGTPLGEDEPVAAVKVELEGRTDYVVYSADNEVTYTVDGLFDFCGFVGVYTINTATNEVVRTYINDGTQIGDATQEQAAVTGEVVDFTRELAFENFIEVDVDNAVVDDGLLENLVGRMIVIENDGVDNAAYVIETAEKKGDNLLIGTGSVDLARRRVLNEDLSIIPNFAVGNSYRIALSTTEGSIDKIPVKEPVIYTFNNTAINQSDSTAWDTSEPNASLTRVIGYGTGENAHNWYFYGFGLAAQKAWDEGGAVNQLANFNSVQIRIKAVNGTEGTSGYFDTTADGGTTVALSIKAPEAGYYKAEVKDHNGAAWNTTLDNPTIAIGPEKSGVSDADKPGVVDGYISSAAYEIPLNGAIYSDGETPIILAINNNDGTSYKRFGSLVLTPLTTGKVGLSTEEITINEVGDTENISVKVGNVPFVEGFAQFVSANEDVATVSPAGVVTGIADGTTTIKVTVGDFEGEVPVKVGTGINTPPEEVILPTFSSSMQANLTLEANVYLNIYFKLENIGTLNPEELQDRVGLLVWDASSAPSAENATYENCSEKMAGGEWNESDGRFKVRSEGIPAKELGDAITFRPYLQNEDGSYTYGKIVSNYCPSVYCYKQLQDTNPADDELMITILNYGAAAQEFFGYRTDSLMNADLTEAQKVINWDGSLVRSDWSVPESKAGSLVRSSKITSRSANLTLLGAIDYNYQIAVDSTVDVESVEIMCWTESAYNAAQTLTRSNATLIADMTYDTSKGKYEYKYEGLPAKMMFSPIYTCAVVTDTDGNEYYGGVVPYCPERFAYISTNSNSVSDAEKKLAKCIVIYGNAAREYFKA